jgi:hypothetical protein
MNSDELTKKLAELEKNKNSIVLQMDKLYGDIQKIMQEKAPQWIDREIERRITDRSDYFQSMGIDKQKEMKLKVVSLKNTIPQLISSEFENQSKWTHHIEVPINADQYREDRAKELHYQLALRNVVSNLGSILSEYGLLVSGSYQSSTWQKVAEGKFLYSIGIDYETHSNPILKNYAELLEKYRELSRQIPNVRKELSEANAKELWNKI